MTDTTLNRFISSGTNAQRLAFTPVQATPASGPSPSAIWFETDTGDTYMWNFGTLAWAKIDIAAGAGFGYEASPTVPVLANFTLLNAGTAALSAGVGGVRLDAPTATTNMRLAKLNAGPPATPYILKARVAPLPPSGGTNSYTGGIFFMNSGSGKIIFLGRFGQGLLAQNWTNFTTFNSGLMSAGNIVGSAPYQWFGLGNDGVNVSILVSTDGKDWYTFATTSTLASFIISVDTIGFGCMTNAAEASCICQSLRAA